MKIFEMIDAFTQRIAENLERKVSRSFFLKSVLSAFFMSLMTLTATNKAFANGSYSWCQSWYPPETGCTFPNGRRCSGCSSSQSTKCPTGHSVYKRWYTSTGCWCVSYSWGSIACCDCMPSGKSGDSNACGCAINL